MAIATAALLAAVVGAWLWHGASRERWALKTTVEIARLVDAGEFVEAVALLREARAILPKDPTLEKLWLKATGEGWLSGLGQYVALRALGEPDAFPAADLVLRKAAAGDGPALTARALAARAEAWRPWRSYAVFHLWGAATASPGRASRRHSGE